MAFSAERVQGWSQGNQSAGHCNHPGEGGWRFGAAETVGNEMPFMDIVKVEPIRFDYRSDLEAGSREN